jgi:hypothetical protein
MSMSFASPSMRAAGSDLTVQISPLGLVELSDEEFEVHGPRLNRYANNWAFYLGHHWAYRREPGEPQLTFNYTKALSDFITNFTYNHGVQFRSPKMYQHIVPGLLKRVWEVDNDKEAILWEMGQQGSVSGDCFTKVAWDPAFQNPATGETVPGRVRILPLNSSYCFPEWHPHDRDRLIRFKLKYRFWGTAPEGTRQVYTYTEIMTEDVIEEYVNDEMIDQRPNPLGVIPIVHTPNVMVSGSPWGLSDIADITGLNREYNEKAVEISDIINYHAAPVTIITGGKASNLEKGPKKVWSIPTKEAKVFNLEGGVSAVGPAMEYLESIKRAMHEMTGVPESALGQMQPISNTSGVALSIMYQPMMQRYHMKRMSATIGFEKINALVLKTIFYFDPPSLQFDPTTEGTLSDIDPETQPMVLDPNDPLVYKTFIHWPPPLPVDALIKLNEIQAKMALGLESKRGALADLGNEFPDEKMGEIFEELVADAKDQAALDMLKAQFQAVILEATGIQMGEGETQPPAPQGNGESDTDSGPAGPSGPPPVSTPMFMGKTPDEMNQLMTEFVTRAYGTRIPQRRNPDN